jgi:hypothetical protein
MSAKPCDDCKMIMVNYANLWLLHSHVVSLLDTARLQLRELKTRSTLLGACTSYTLLRSDLETSIIEIKNLKHKLDHSSRYTVLFPLCVVCDSLKGKHFHANKENIKLKQEVTYLTARLERVIVSEKMIENDLSRIEESATKSTYKLSVGFERCGDKSEKRAPKFVLTSNYHKEEERIKFTKPHYPSSPKTSFKPKRDVKKENPKPTKEAFICIFCGRADHLDEFCFRHKRIEKCRFDSARNSYRDEFSDFLPRFFSCTSSHALSHFSHEFNHCSYGFGSRENNFLPIRFGYGPRSYRGDRFSYRSSFPIRGSHTHFESRCLDGPYFPRRGSCPIGPNDEVQRNVKISFGHMVKC